MIGIIDFDPDKINTNEATKALDVLEMNISNYNAELDRQVQLQMFNNENSIINENIFYNTNYPIAYRAVETAISNLEFLRVNLDYKDIIEVIEHENKEVLCSLNYIKLRHNNKYPTNVDNVWHGARISFGENV